MKKIDLSKTTLRVLTADETGDVAGAALSGALTCGGSDHRTCIPSAVVACQTITCAPCSCPGPQLTRLPPC